MELCETHMQGPGPDMSDAGRSGRVFRRTRHVKGRTVTLSVAVDSAALCGRALALQDSPFQIVIVSLKRAQEGREAQQAWRRNGAASENLQRTSGTERVPRWVWRMGIRNPGSGPAKEGEGASVDAAC